ncbi:MAG TPA: EamA/RhaT family transporter [Burkholderiales bacterium]|nr:EamA/RhaT family transporter [Burkholderiales bacterium]
MAEHFTAQVSAFLSAHAWALFTIAAATAQTARNAMQRGLTAKVGVAGASWARFIFALPFALLSLAAVLAYEAGHVFFENGYASWLLLGSFAQMAATATMLLAMRDRSFVTVIAYTKTEPIQVALFALVLLGERLSPLKTFAVLIGTIAVMLFSWPRKGAHAARDVRSAAWGILAGAGFALAAVGYRGAITHIVGASFFTAATVTLAATLCIQTILSIAWLALADREALRTLFVAWQQSVPAGFAGALAPQFWFLAFALQAAPAVRTLGLIEVLFAQAVSWRFLREKMTAREWLAMALLLVALVAILQG